MTLSAGILLYRHEPLRVLIAHPGGPFWAVKDKGAWSIPKGLVDAGEEVLGAARREFTEETSADLPESGFVDLGRTTLKSGKEVAAFAIAGEVDADAVVSNTFPLEWPPKTGRMIEVPEIDVASWETPSDAVDRLNPAQGVFVERLVGALADGVPEQVESRDTWPIRQQVLRPHQSVEEMLQADEDTATHFAVRSHDQVVAIGSVFTDPGPGADLRVRFMGTAPEQRRRGLASRILERCIDLAARAGSDLWCSARVPASGFYLDHGFETVGDPHDVEGIGPHVTMRRARQDADIRPVVGLS
ncbi:MAG: GNAT family N-acetyltransferase [Acidimicrobiia bacterium]|nr:GNAT family N-acetyltransferase [Acidimicrobiia bacterium]NNC74745.1 GNAT family N-acetyltransferase [Acidimicrobiia bacterium]